MHGKLEGQEGKSDQEVGRNSISLTKEEFSPSVRRLNQDQVHSFEKESSRQFISRRPGTGQSLPSCRRASLQYIGSSQSRDLKRQFSQESRPSSDVTGKPFLEKGRTNVNRSPAKDGSRRKRSIFDQREDFQEDLRHHRDGGERGRNLRRDDARSRRQSPETRTRHERNGVEGDLERIREKENVRERGREHAREEREKRQVPKREELVFCGEFRSKKILENDLEKQDEVTNERMGGRCRQMNEGSCGIRFVVANPPRGIMVTNVAIMVILLERDTFVLLEDAIPLTDRGFRVFPNGTTMVYSQLNSTVDLELITI
ncbi:uncharacterized protein LOC143246053 [Tachypleus tridentatus]|uniref:uncharacterized protein LOC143246053 n=1 Tax=Tachypleus tridentatus TaxID=6853 RepID=UPI003FD061E6